MARSRRTFLFWTMGSAVLTALPVKIRKADRIPRRPLRIARPGTHDDSGCSDAYELNETASFILCRCDGRRSVEQIAQELAEWYDVKPRRARREVYAFVKVLKRSGLVT